MIALLGLWTLFNKSGQREALTQWVGCWSDSLRSSVLFASESVQSQASHQMFSISVFLLCNQYNDAQFYSAVFCRLFCSVGLCGRASVLVYICSCCLCYFTLYFSTVATDTGDVHFNHNPHLSLNIPLVSIPAMCVLWFASSQVFLVLKLS